MRSLYIKDIIFYLSILNFLIIGILTIIFGYQLLKLKKKYGRIGDVLAKINIIYGISNAIVILAFLSPFIALIISITEAIFFFKAHKIEK